MDFFSTKTNNEPQKGDLLISEPFLPDPNFERTVLLICEHNEEGTIGFVINKKSNVSFDDVVDEVEGFKEKLYIGGPVQQNSLHFIHRTSQILNNSIKLLDDVYWGNDFDKLLSMINTRSLVSSDVKFFLGYSGWSPNQLKEEIKQNSWIIYRNPSSTQIFDYNSMDHWKKILNDMGGRYRMMSNYPIDPRLN